MIIPYTELDPETLQSLIEEFVSREGTDYGEVEIDFGEKVGQVKSLLESGEATIVFVASRGECNIVRADSL